MYTVPGTCTVLYVVRSLQQNKWQSARKYWRWLACTVNNAVDARIVEAGASVSTGEYAVNARIVEALASVLIAYCIN